ncbi:MAG: Uma2 family endonuclease [Chloroflexota bacterium]
MSDSKNPTSENLFGSTENGPTASTSHEDTAQRRVTANGTCISERGINGASYHEDTTIQPNGFQDPEFPMDEDDPFRYGWRFIEMVDEKGRFEYEQIPLTLEDLLHPQEGDFRVQTRQHIKTCVNLQTILPRRLTDWPHAVVLYDHRVDWNIPGIKAFGPDITVVLDAEKHPEMKGTYVSGEDGIPPTMVIEVTSRSTRSQDFFEKPELMQRIGLPYYYVIDIARVKRNRRIYGYELTEEGHYVGIRPNVHGWVWMEPVSLWLGLQDGKAECYDADGNIMLDPEGLAKNLEVALQRAEEEAKRAEEEAKRADAAIQRANEEAQRADALSEENERLAAYLRSVGIDPATIISP